MMCFLTKNLRREYTEYAAEPITRRISRIVRLKILLASFSWWWRKLFSSLRK